MSLATRPENPWSWSPLHWIALPSNRHQRPLGKQAKSRLGCDSNPNVRRQRREGGIAMLRTAEAALMALRFLAVDKLIGQALPDRRYGRSPPSLLPWFLKTAAENSPRRVSSTPTR